MKTCDSCSTPMSKKRGLWLFGLLFLVFPLYCNAVIFEAESYDSFFDLSPGNAGGAFRQDDVDIEPTSDVGGGFNVGWIDAGEWLLFHQLVIPATGDYRINLRVASLAGAFASLDLNSGSIPLGQFTIPATMGWQNWTTVSRTLTINQGVYDLGIFAVTGGWNVNSIEIIPVNLTSGDSTKPTSSSPDDSLATNQVIRFEAENYINFFDTSAGNEGGALRSDNVDIELTADDGGGFNVGWIDAGEWLAFHSFNIPETGSYTVHLRVASLDGAVAAVDLNAGAIPLGDFIIPPTGAWQQWITVSRTLTLDAGTFNLGVFAKTAGWNLNWIEITSNISGGSQSSESSQSSASSQSSTSSQSSASSQSSESSQSSASSRSLGDTITDRSLFVHDEATLQAADFSLRRTLSQLMLQLNGANPTQPTSVSELFARMWDTQNPAPGVISGGQKCTGQLNGYSIVCRPVEGAQASNPSFFIDSYIPIGLVNRFDLRDKVNFSDCGEYRIIYGLVGAGGRNFIIFESQLPNPAPGRPEGCLPVAQFWQELSSENDPQQRALKLRDFYYGGIPSADVIPVVSFGNYTEGTGQIRTNQFMEGIWLLKEFKIVINQEGLSTIDAVSVKSNPVDFLFDAQSVDGRSTDFQSDFIDNLNSLLTDFNTFSLTVANDVHNNGQSHASGFLFTENMFSTPFFGGTDDRFRQAVNSKLVEAGSELTANQVIARATVMTCAGCHNPGSFGLTNQDAIGPGQSWPNTLGFTHINEFAFNGVFPLSQALNDVFLPVRREDLREYLLNTPTTSPAAAFMMLRRSLPTNVTPVVKPGKRSG